MTTIMVSSCKCGGYGVVFDELTERRLGRCHDLLRGDATAGASVDPTVHERAVSYLNSQILSHGGCVERLRSINNDAVNKESQAATVGRMERELNVFQYLLAIVEKVSA